MEVGGDAGGEARSQAGEPVSSVQHEQAGAGKHLFHRRAKQRRMKKLATFTNILYMKIPVFDPDRILTWMYGYLSWIFTTWFFFASVGLMLAAASHVALHYQTFQSKLPAYQAVSRGVVAERAR